MKRLTPSQWHSIIAGAVGLASLVVENAPRIEAALPSARWIAPALSLVALGVAMASRGLKTSTSGTGEGLIATGPDVYAQAALAAAAPAVDAAEQQVIDLAVAHFRAQQNRAVKSTADVLKTATEYGLSASALADGHAALDAANGQSVPKPAADAISVTGGNQ